MSFATEFPGFPADSIPADVFTEGWTDTSYHNDIAPSFEKGRFTVFIDYPEPADRECPECPRFRVYGCEDSLAGNFGNGCESDNWADILDYIAKGGI